MPSEWCPVCCTRHGEQARCPGELRATGPERHGWRVNVETPHGIEAYGILVAEALDVWRARILTYPNVLWLVPRGRGTAKFVGRTPREAERRAVEFIREHCRQRDYRMRDEVVEVLPGPIDQEMSKLAAFHRKSPAPRKIRFLRMRFGVVSPTEPGGTGNLSETGLFIITSTPVDSGAQLKMLLDLDDTRVPLEGAVRWMRKQPHMGRSPGMGVQLRTPPRAYLDYVRTLH